MKTNRQLSDLEGNCCAVPLRNGGFARGVIARISGKGPAFGYFFGPRCSTLQELQSLGIPPGPEGAILLTQFGDLGLKKEVWPIIGRLPDWNREDWPMPGFIRYNDDRTKAFIDFCDDDTVESVKEIVVPVDEIDPNDFAEEGLYGYVALQIRLDVLLSAQS
ncbi:immunity 26/phosphotriesterase HocA family protein [bacterium]|nr:immunity 26/phosphotriesterase HocA family protein [bacterium]